MGNTTGIIVLLIYALVLHLIEEVKTSFRQCLPVGEMPLWLFVTINVAVYVFCFATLTLSVRNGKLATPFAWAFAAAMFLNRLGHVGMMVLRWPYFPGGLTALLLLVLSGTLILRLLGVA